MKGFLALLVLTLSFLPIKVRSQTKPEKNDRSWIDQSNRYTKQLIDLDKKYTPEYGSAQGLAEYDTQIAIPTLANQRAERKEQEALVARYVAAAKTEKAGPVAQDLHILIDHLKLGFRRQDFEMRRKVPFLNAASMIYDGLEILLDDQTPAARRQAAVVRMQKYAGLEKGYRPLTATLQDRVAQQIAGHDMIYPSRQQMEVELSRNESIITGIAELCQKHKLTGWEQPYAELKKQVQAYDQWTREQVLIKARTDFRLPPEEYALALEDYGIDIPPAQLAKIAHAAFTEIQNEMKPIAEQIAKKRNLPSRNYRDVIRELKKNKFMAIPLFRFTSGT
ncbi:hypothetical protein AHMF7616_02837 [Adhaeribacter pallidiroseus]|uniref:Uncharacterized protein n=1 Tax=Adhaeribacter pallidiroseus TaxID=2072847 RepID=A0A369QKQ3_9BACT|nr:hypothetical protein AHMF7616_02837 [Adhaeribacter pallidiroseus]